VVVGDGEEGKALEFEAVSRVGLSSRVCGVVGKGTHLSGRCTGQVRKVMDIEGWAQGVARRGSSMHGRSGARESVWIENQKV